MGRLLPSLGLLACVVAFGGIGCGGGTDYSDNDNGTGGVGTDLGTTPTVVSSSPQLRVEGVRDQILIIASENVTPDVNLETVPFNPRFLKVSANENPAVNYPSTYTLMAPRIWADRRFVEWRLDNTVIETDPILPVAQIPSSLNGRLTAVYEPYILPADTNFAPNYLADLVLLIPRPVLPFKIWIDPNLTPDLGLRQRFFNGLDKWKRASGGVIDYIRVETAGEADIRFRSALSLPNLPEGVLGIAVPRELIDSLSDDSNYTDIYLTPAQNGGQNAIDQLNYEATVAHEFGHALGMIGHSSNPTDMMYAFNGPLEVTQRDINTVASLYKTAFNGGTTVPTRP
jgi:hypothetical protein